MRPFNRLLTTLLLMGSLACEARGPTLYSLASGNDASQPEATVKLQRTSNSGALLLLTFDGADPRSFPSMATYAARVKSAEAAMKPGQKPGLINASPGRNEPQLVGVAPGMHKYGVLFMLIDVSKGGLLNSGIASTLEKKYLPEDYQPDSEVKSVTVKHYEELSFNAESGKNYFVESSWSDNTSELKLHVAQCSSDWKDCKDVAFDSTNAQTKVLPGVSNQEL